MSVYKYIVILLAENVKKIPVYTQTGESAPPPIKNSEEASLFAVFYLLTALSGVAPKPDSV